MYGKNKFIDTRYIPYIQIYYIKDFFEIYLRYDILFFLIIILFMKLYSMDDRKYGIESTTLEIHVYSSMRSDSEL